MYKQSKLINDKLVDSAKSTFSEFKKKLNKFVEETRVLVNIEELLTERTYFRFLQEMKNSDVGILDEDTVVVDNEGYEMDFGAVAGPALTRNNYRIGFIV